MNVVFNKSDVCQLAAVKKLLEAAHLPFEDIDTHFENFIVAAVDGKPVGAVGVERHGCDGLLRSFVVDEAYRGGGIGKELLDRLTTLAGSLGISTLYLLTTSADGYFGRQGFSVMRREELPATIRQTREFASICPVSAVCMFRVV